MPNLVGFIGGSYTGQGKVIDAERSVNLYPELVAKGATGKNVAALIGTPGKTSWQTLPDGPTRALWAGAQRLFGVGGGTFFEIFGDPTVPPVSNGNLNIDPNPAQIFPNGTQLFVTSGGQGYCTVGTAGAVTLQAVVPASTGTFADGYFVAAQPNSNQFRISALNDGTSWDPLDFGVKQGYPDAISSIFWAFKQLWLFGFDTTEVWYDSGAANFPFQLIPGGLLEYGCYAPYSVAKVGNTLCWLGGESFSGAGVVYQTNGLIPQRISNHALEYQIQNVYGNIRGAIGSNYQEAGHNFYRLDFPNTSNPNNPAAPISATWLYDLASGYWHERAFWNNGQYQADIGRYHAFVFDKHIVGDYRSGKLYTQSLNIYTDDGHPIRRLRSTPHITEEMLWRNYDYLQLDMQVGEAPDDLAGNAINLEGPQVMLRWSDDGGLTWSNEKYASSGPRGKYSQRVMWRRLGRSRDRVFEISSSEPIEHVWVAAYLRTREGSGV